MGWLFWRAVSVFFGAKLSSISWSRDYYFNAYLPTLFEKSSTVLLRLDSAAIYFAARFVLLLSEGGVYFFGKPGDIKRRLDKVRTNIVESRYCTDLLMRKKLRVCPESYTCTILTLSLKFSRELTANCTRRWLPLNSTAMTPTSNLCISDSTVAEEQSNQCLLRVVHRKK